MSRIGNLSGPSIEGILASIPPSQFDWSPQVVEEDMAWEERETQAQQIEPVKLDEHGQPFLKLSASDGKLVLYPIHSPALKGEILAEQEMDGKRYIGVAEQVALHQWRLKIASLQPA